MTSTLLAKPMIPAALQTASFTAVGGRIYPINATSADVVATLPVGARQGTTITFTRADSSNHAVTVQRGGSDSINSGLTTVTSLALTAQGQTVTLVSTGGGNWVIAQLTSAGGGSTALTPTAVKTSAYTAAVSDLIPVDTTSGAVTVSLPTGAADKSQVAVKHIIQGGTNAVTIAAGGSDVFNKAGGSTSLTLAQVNQGMVLQYKAAGGIWYVVNDSLSLAALQAANNAAYAPLIGGASITGTEPHQADTSFIANVGPILTAPGGQQMRVRVNALGFVQLDPIGAIQPAVFVPLLGSTTPVTGTGSSMTINVPSGTVNGSVMVAVIGNRGSQTINTPTGWTLVRTTTGGAFDSTPQLSTFVRVASSEPASYTWTFSGSTMFSGSIATFGNVNTTTPVVSSVELRGSSGEPALSIPSVPAYGMVLFAAAVDTYNGTTTNGNGSVTDPSGSVPVWDAAQGPYAHSHLSLISASAAGGTVAASATHSPAGANFATQLIALNPASVVSSSLPQLRWAPPNTSGYTPLTINSNGGNQQTINLAAGTDYVISAPSPISGGVVLAGGRNVVWIGGEINIPTQADAGSSDNINRRALLMSGQTGVVHLEGLLLDGVDINEGIDLACPNATVQIQNVRAVNMHAHDETGFTDNHVDFIQTWGGCLELRVDKCTFQSDYQGVTIKDDFNSSRQVVRMSRVNGRSYSNLGQYFYWFDAAPGKRGDVYLEDVWAPSDAFYTDIGKQVWPDKNNVLTAFPQRAIVSGSTVSWPSSLSPMIVGMVQQGQPSGGDFAPSGTPGAGIAGAGYTTPGYQYASYVAPVIYSALFVGSSAPTVGQVPTWNGSQYSPATPTTAPPAVSVFRPADPTGTVSTTLVMAGVGSTVSYTPTSSTGKVKITAVGICGTATSPVNVTIYGRYGTGTAPANGVAVTGTAWGKSITARPANSTASSGNTPFTAMDVISGLTRGTAYWFDFAFDTANASDTAFLANMLFTVEECA